MKTNEEILNEFGQKVIEDCFDNQLKFILNNVDDLVQTEEYKNLFHNMSVVQKEELENYSKQLLEGVIFDFLKIFEEYPEFKIIYEENDKQINLNEISEMLKAEHLEEDGWIKRFSNYK